MNLISNPSLDIKKSVEELRTLYKNDPRQSSMNALILGETGTGKTYLMRTARKPIHIDSFDPGGTKSLSDMIENGDVVPDTRWENEDPKNPNVYDKWRKELDRRIKNGYFSHFATYVIDSSTTWSEAIMNWILSKSGIAGQPPRWAHDYVPQKVEIRNQIRKCLDLPCDFFMLGHLEGFKDEVTGGMAYRFMTTGKGVVTLPLLFDELWVMDPKQTSNGVEYRILTQSTGRHLARSRLARGGILDVFEKPDIKALLKKAKKNSEDKPKI